METPREPSFKKSTASDRAAKALEWDRFVELAAREARTEPGKARIRALVDASAWAGSAGSARVLQQETQETTPILDRDGLWGPLLDLTDPTETLGRLERGSVLEIAELVLIRRWLYALDSWVQTPREEIRGELLRKSLASLPDPHGSLQILDRILTPEGELSERASPRLASLYAEIRSLKRDISSMLDQLIKTFSQKGVLQESFTDVRDGRYVIPVKISSQGEIDGIIYEASASRQTVFVEPREVAPLNNRLRQRQNDLIQEIYAILEEASRKLKPFHGEIVLAVETLAHWDAVQARARIGLHYSGRMVQVTEERAFLMHQTAHPLLWWSLDPPSIIRNEIDFGAPLTDEGTRRRNAPVETPRTLLLTGPNTGGKTVLLKTLGLAAICARTGFPFPATELPIMPFFTSIFADLGDPQSIEQHLSSFSGHVMRFKDILENVTDQSLVLIDELNSATDPEEGAALGRAFLETVMGRGAMIVTTTHDPHLKASAVADSRILNASMQFDETARTPTYRIALGVPGRSRALETAARLGISPDVIALARGYLTREHLEFERMLSRLESDSREAERARKEAVAIREEAERFRKEWTERTESNVGEMLDRTRQKLRRILEQAQDDVRASVRKLDEMKTRREVSDTREKISDTYTAASELLEAALHEEAPQVAEALDRKKKEKAPRPEAEELLKTGASVRIPKWKSTGTILSIEGGKLKVAMGNLQMTLSPDEVEPLPGARPKTPSAKISGLTSYSLDKTPPRQLDIRGKRLDEAMSEVEAYVDQSFRSGAVEVTIVHGLGTGALREGTRKILSSAPYVKTFRDGGAGHGGTGATLVEFERD